MREGMGYLCRAYDADPGQPGALIILARLCLLRGDAGRARELARAALAAAGTDAARAAALALQGRAHHAAGQWADAYRCYSQVGHAPQLRCWGWCMAYVAYNVAPDLLTFSRIAPLCSSGAPDA
jgi:tetratricopeptide (TPR) repeat protein